MNFILWNFNTCSRLKSGDGINMRTNPKAKEVTQSAVIIILLALKLANILSFYHDFFSFLGLIFGFVGFSDWLFFSFLQRWIQMQLCCKSSSKMVILLIGYSVFLKHKYILGRWLCRILFKHYFSYFCVEIFFSYMIFLTFM